jgi:hypothetical protein
LIGRREAVVVALARLDAQRQVVAVETGDVAGLFFQAELRGDV